MEPLLVRRMDCDHGDLAVIGSGGDALYGRCRGCGLVVIEQGGRAWVLRPTAET